MIGFLHPWVLAALPLAALPIILHLLKRREPPTVPFPAVRYLRTATEEHQRRFRLQNWLLLLVRSLLIVALILAAAGPGLPLSGVPGHAPTALVVDRDVVDRHLVPVEDADVARRHLRQGLGFGVHYQRFSNLLRR